MQVFGRRDSEAIVAALAAVGVGVIAAAFASGLSFDAALDAAVHPAAMTVMLVSISIPLIRWAVDGDRVLFQLVLGGLAAKSVGMYLRFTLTGAGDNRAYHRAGTQVAHWLSESIIGPNELPTHFGDSGTDRLSYAIGWLYYFTGSRRLTAFVCFTFISFVGLLLLYRAAITAIPELDRKRYALLLFYMPALLFWPSTIGKEAWMIAFVGVAAMGVSALVRQRISLVRLAVLAFGLIMAGQVRPHIAALVLAALLAAVLWPTGVGGSRARRLISVAIAFAFLSVALREVADYFGGDSLAVNSILDFAQGRTAEGNSEFNPTRITGPRTLIPGTISVLFRPFVIEASTLLQLLGALEGVGVIGLIAASHRRIRRLPRLFLERGYVRFAVIYTLGFVIAFSAISNFGILTRQRAQLWPMFLILLAFTPVERKDPRVVSRRRGLVSLGHRANSAGQPIVDSARSGA